MSDNTDVRPQANSDYFHTETVLYRTATNHNWDVGT
jgi:hypothetical protein